MIARPFSRVATWAKATTTSSFGAAGPSLWSAGRRGRVLRDAKELTRLWRRRNDPVHDLQAGGLAVGKAHGDTAEAEREVELGARGQLGTRTSGPTPDHADRLARVVDQPVGRVCRSRVRGRTRRRGRDSQRRYRRDTVGVGLTAGGQAQACEQGKASRCWGHGDRTAASTTWFHLIYLASAVKQGASPRPGGAAAQSHGPASANEEVHVVTQASHVSLKLMAEVEPVPPSDLDVKPPRTIARA